MHLPVGLIWTHGRHTSGGNGYQGHSCTCNACSIRDDESLIVLVAILACGSVRAIQESNMIHAARVCTEEILRSHEASRLGCWHYRKHVARAGSRVSLLMRGLTRRIAEIARIRVSVRLSVVSCIICVIVACPGTKFVSVKLLEASVWQLESFTHRHTARSLRARWQ
jgi:hypothetical protein